MIRFIDVYKEYDNGTKALKGIDLRIDDGEFVFLVGPSGSGKSTIIKLITGEIALTQGKLMVNGYSLNNISPRQVPLMRRTLGIIFQDFRLIDKKTVYENLAFAMRAIGASSRDLKRRSPMSSSWWDWIRRRTAILASSLAGSSSAWPLPGRW